MLSAELSDDAGIALLLHECLTRAAESFPQHSALVLGERRYSYGDIEVASRRLAAELRANGLDRGDRVVIMADNSWELVVALWATLRAGGVFVVLNPTTKTDKLAFILQDCTPQAVVAQPRLARVVLPALTETDATGVGTVFWAGPIPTEQNGRVRHQSIASTVLDPDLAEPGDSERSDSGPGDLVHPGLIDTDLAGLIYTSGSTGEPKGVMLTHRNIVHNTWSVSTYLGLRADDVIGCVLPLSFDYGLFQLFMAARLGACVVLERSFAYPHDVLQQLAATYVTVLPGVPTIFATLLQMGSLDGLDVSSVRLLTNTAAALPPAHIERLTKLFPDATLFSMYGLTECTRVSYLPPERLADKPTSVGIAMPNTEAYVVDDDGQRVGPGVEGELVVRGSSVMRGYWRRPEETAACLQDSEIEGEKRLHTGDRFMMDDEGFLYFVGRGDDVFKSKGEKVSPKEVEQVLYELEAVAEAAVVGVPHDVDGMAIKAVVAPRPGASLTEAQVKRHCRTRLESFLVPRLVELRDSLPKTSSGKIRRAGLG